MSYDVGADLDMGDLDDVGAIPRGIRRRGGRRLGARGTAAIVRSTPPNVNQLAGVAPVSMKELPLGMGAIAFTSVSGTSLSMSVQPQIPFKGRRLVIDVARTGTSSTGLLTITAFSIGVKDQRAGTGSVPVNTFGPGAFQVEMVLDAAGPGINILLTIAISAAPTTTDRVDVGATLIGDGIS